MSATCTTRCIGTLSRFSLTWRESGVYVRVRHREKSLERVRICGLEPPPTPLLFRGSHGASSMRRLSSAQPSGIIEASRAAATEAHQLPPIQCQAFFGKRPDGGPTGPVSVCLADAGQFHFPES